MKSLLRFATIYIALSTVLGLLALVSSFPARPISAHGWLALFALALPLTLAGEFVGELLHRNRVARAVDERTQGKEISWMRIGYLLCIGLLVAAVVLGWVFLSSSRV